MSIVGKIIKVILVTVISVVIWYYVVNRFVSFEIQYVTLPYKSSKKPITSSQGKKSRSYYQQTKNLNEEREITEVEFLRAELTIQTENVARLVKLKNDANRFSAMDFQVKNTKNELTKIRRENQVITNELTSIRDGLTDIQQMGMGVIEDVEDFLHSDIEYYIAHYGIDKFRRSLLTITDHLKNHITQSTGGNLLISDLRVTYRKAQQMCEELGTFLVTIESAEKMHQVQEHVTKLKRWDIWIGLNRMNDHDDYKWDNKAPLSYTNWDDGQPNRRDPYGKYGEEKCVIMWSTGKWHDYRCEVVAYFVCEKPIHNRNDIMDEKFVQIDDPNVDPDIEGSADGRDLTDAQELIDEDDDDDYEDNEDYDEDYEEEDEDEDDYDEEDYEYFEDEPEDDNEDDP